jgi:hypothetical protein
MLSSLLDWLKSRLPRQAEANAGPRPNTELKANAEKALAMKREAEAKEGSHIPPHRTAHEGMRPANDPNADDVARDAEGTYTSQLKRSGVARSGDAS